MGIVDSRGGLGFRKSCHFWRYGVPPSAENAEGWGTLFLYVVWSGLGVGGPPTYKYSRRNCLADPCMTPQRARSFIRLAPDSG